MQKRMECGIGKILGRAMVVLACGVLVTSAAQAQGGPCAVSQVRVRIGTAAQNPLANNLDIEIHFTDGTIQTASNVNGTAVDANGTSPWAINSQMVVTIPLKQTVSVTEIKRVRLIDHTSGAEWDMSFLRARAFGSGGFSMLIAEWGTNPNPAPHQFTPTYPAFGVYTKIPISPCAVAQMPVQGPTRVAPGTPVESSRLLTNERIVQMVRQGQPEMRIISAIRANPGNFDLSLNKLLALHREGVSGHVLNAMVIAALQRRKGLSGAGGANADELSPQPYPPKSRINAAGKANEAELSPQPYPPKNGTLLSPSTQQTMLGTQASPAAGDGGKSALLPAVQQPAVTNGTMGDGSVQPGASSLPAVQTGTLNGTGKTAVTANRAAVTAPAMMQKTSPGTIGAGHTMSAQGNVSSSAMLTRPAGTVAVTPQATTTASSLRTANLAAVGGMPSKVSLQVAAECTKDPTRRILSISSSADSSTSPHRLAIRMRPAPVIFRPGPQYTIWGCSLGSLNNQNAGVVFLHAPGPFSGAMGGLGGLSNPWLYFLFALDIHSWTDNAIVASFPSDPPTLESLRQYGFASSDGVDIEVSVQSALTYEQVNLDGVGFSTYAQ